MTPKKIVLRTLEIILLVALYCGGFISVLMLSSRKFTEMQWLAFCAAFVVCFLAYMAVGWCRDEHELREIERSFSRAGTERGDDEAEGRKEELDV